MLNLARSGEKESNQAGGLRNTLHSNSLHNKRLCAWSWEERCNRDISTNDHFGFTFPYEFYDKFAHPDQFVAKVELISVYTPFACVVVGSITRQCLKREE